MHHLLLLGVLSFAACGDKPADDTAPPEGDTDTDTDTDADSDTDVDWDWSHCPASDAYVGDQGWGATLEVTGGAVYCGLFDEERTLEDELAAKAVLKVVPGDYPVPVDDGTYTLALPACTLTAAGPGPGLAGEGTTRVHTYGWEDQSFASLTGSQPMSEGLELSHSLVLVGEGEAPSALRLDGQTPDVTTGAGAYFSLGSTPGEEEDRPNRFGSCFDPSWTLNTHTVTFDGGEVVLDLYIGTSMESTEPGIFRHAEGVIDGQDFVQDDYFGLVYRPAHHHFRRNFAVIFDTPIGTACSLRVEGIDPYATEPTAQVSTADCELAVIEERAVSAESLD